MPAPKGNKNATRAKHQRVAVSFSNGELDALYDYLAQNGEIIIGDDPAKIRDLVKNFVRARLRRFQEDQGAIIL